MVWRICWWANTRKVKDVSKKDRLIGGCAKIHWTLWYFTLIEEKKGINCF